MAFSSCRACRRNKVITRSILSRLFEHGTYRGATGWSALQDNGHGSVTETG
jgi:hypothetical protein